MYLGGTQREMCDTVFTCIHVYGVCLVCISTSPHDTVCLVTQCFCVLLCGWEERLVAGLVHGQVAHGLTGQATPGAA